MTTRSYVGQQSKADQVYSSSVDELDADDRDYSRVKIGEPSPWRLDTIDDQNTKPLFGYYRR